MTQESSQRLIRELVADLSPVRPLAPLWVVLGGILALWAAMAAAALLLMGPRPDLAERIAGDSVYSAVTLGLGLAGLGGLAAGLAASLPGREALRLGTLTMAVSGLAVAGAFCLSAERSLVAVDPMVDLACMFYATLLALPVVGFTSVRALRGWILQPSRMAIISLLGAGSLGALIVHLTCPAGAAAHFLAAHLGAGPIIALLGAVPLSAALRRASD